MGIWVIPPCMERGVYCNKTPACLRLEAQLLMLFRNWFSNVVLLWDTLCSLGIVRCRLGNALNKHHPYVLKFLKYTVFPGSTWKWTEKVIKCSNRTCHQPRNHKPLNLGAVWKSQREMRDSLFSMPWYKKISSWHRWFHQTVFDLKHHFKHPWKAALCRLSFPLSREQWLNSSQNTAETPEDKSKVQILWSL